MKNSSFAKLINNPCFYGLALLVFLLTFSVNVKADEVGTSDLPYIPRAYPNAITNEELAIIQQNITSHGYTYSVYDDKCIIFRGAEGAWYNGWTYLDCQTFYIYFLDSYVNDLNFPSGKMFANYDIDTEILNVDFVDYCTRFRVGYREEGYYFDYDPPAINISRGFYGDPTLTHIQNDAFDFYFNINYPIYTSTDFYGNDYLGNSGSWLNVGEEVPSERPSPSVPRPEDPFPDVVDDRPSPQTPPVKPSAPPTRPDPTVPNPPTVDTSSVETLLSSIADILKWGFGVVVEWIKVCFYRLCDILDYIIAYAVYLGDLLKYLVQTIILNIQSFADAVDYYLEKFWNFISSIIDGSLFVDLFIPSEEDITDFIENNDDLGIIGFISAVVTKFKSIISSLFNLSVTKSLYVPSVTFHGVNIGGFYIDFSWYDHYKTYFDTIISGFLILGWLYWAFLQLHSMLRAGNVVDFKGSDRS